MKKIFLCLFSLFIFNSCSKKNTPLYVEESLKPFVDKFILAAQFRNIPINTNNLVVKLGDANDINPQVNKVGYCAYDNSNNGFEFLNTESNVSTVIIDSRFWNRTDINDIQRTELIFHELGHCILGRKHDTRLYKNQPESLMYPNLVSMSYFISYRANENYYFDELFKLRPSALQGNPQFDDGNGIFTISEEFPEENSESKDKGIFIFTEDGCFEQ